MQFVTFLSLEKTFSWLDAIAESDMSRITKSLSSIVSYLVRHRRGGDGGVMTQINHRQGQQHNRKGQPR